MFDLDLIDSMFDFQNLDLIETKFELYFKVQVFLGEIWMTLPWLKNTIRLRLRFELESLLPPLFFLFLFWGGGVGWFF
jgi:hypothetical protein